MQKTERGEWVFLLDNIYFSNYSNTLSLNPMYLLFEISNQNEITSVKDNLKKYNNSVPFWFFIYNEKLNEYTYFKIKSLFKTNEGLIEDYKNKLIKDLI